MLRILLGDFDFNYLATSYPVCGTIFFLLYIVFIFFIVSNLFVVVMCVCFYAVRRDVARRQKPFYLVDLLNKVLYTAWVYIRRWTGAHVPLLFQVEGTPCVFGRPCFFRGRHFCTNAHDIHGMIGAIFVKFSQLISVA